MPGFVVAVRNSRIIRAFASKRTTFLLVQSPPHVTLLKERGSATFIARAHALGLHKYIYACNPFSFIDVFSADISSYSEFENYDARSVWNFSVEFAKHCREIEHDKCSNKIWFEIGIKHGPSDSHRYRVEHEFPPGALGDGNAKFGRTGTI